MLQRSAVGRVKRHISCRCRGMMEGERPWVGRSMNPRQKVAILVGMALFDGAGLYPPWTWRIERGSDGASTKSVHPRGYSPLWSLPPPGNRRLGYIQLDLPRLIVEFVTIVVVTCGTVVVLTEPFGRRHRAAPKQRREVPAVSGRPSCGDEGGAAKRAQR